MAKLSPAVLAAIRQVAEARRIPAPFLLTVFEVETGGQPFEQDGKTPRFLFERHKFAVHLPKAKLALALKAGLAIPKWLGPGSSQYKDQKTSAQRLALLSRITRIDEEAAWRSCSIGLPQVMGSNYAACGYASATEMAREFESVVAQVQAGVDFMVTNRLMPKLLAKDWRGFAKGYNGSAYERNQYHTKLAAAFSRWNAPNALAPKPAGALAVGDTGPQVYALQATLKEKGLRTAEPDGVFASATQRQVFVAQASAGLTVTGAVTPDDLQAIVDMPEPDLGAKESMSLKEARKAVPTISLLAMAKKGFWGALALLGVGGAQDSDPVSGVQSAVDKVTSAKDAAESVWAMKDSAMMVVDWGVAHWPLAVAAVAILGAYAVVHKAELAAYCGWKESA